MAQCPENDLRTTHIGGRGRQYRKYDKKFTAGISLLVRVDSPGNGGGLSTLPYFNFAYSCLAC